MTDEQIAAIRERWAKGRYVYISRKRGDPLRGVQQDCDGDVEALLDALEEARRDYAGLMEHHSELVAQYEAENARLRVDVLFSIESELATWQDVPYPCVPLLRERLTTVLHAQRAALTRTEPPGA